MEMESSRRSSVDRSRELPGIKRPRLSQDVPSRDRGANGGLASRVPSGDQPANQRFRANEREDLVRVSSSSSSFQQHQELVAQYKTALAELTFNSKPIITNLTIIAGENLHAAKGIAATICNNVLEVTSEQKLPSLYLLDSIVKNIGRDYIKCFAARLPEVFCTAYRQVDSSIRSGMKHLFGTWRGVFPPGPLQMIEKELGFSPVISGSSGTTTLRSDPQTQRSAYSIHVNPKYLEARHLQQTKAKEINRDEDSDMVAPSEDTERLDGKAISRSTRQWANISDKMPNIQRPERELLNDSFYEKKGIRDVKDHQFSSSVLPRQSEQGVGSSSKRINDQDELELLDKSYIGAGGTASKMVTSRRNGCDANQSYGNYGASGFSLADRQLPPLHINNANKNVQPASKNWKNSDEEEYMWNDLDSKLTDFDGWNSDKADKRAGLQRGQWIPREREQLEFHQDRVDTFPRVKPSSIGEGRFPLFKGDENHLQLHKQWDADTRQNLDASSNLLSTGQAASGLHASPMWPQREPLPVPGLNQTSSRFAGQPDSGAISVDSGSPTNLISSLSQPVILSHSHQSSLALCANVTVSGTFGQQRQQSLQPPSSPAHLSSSFQPLQHQKLHSAVDHHHPQPSYSQMGQKPLQLPGHINRTLHMSVTQDSSPSTTHQQLSHGHNLHQSASQSSQPSSISFTQLRHQPPFLYQSEQELPHAQPQSQLLIHLEKSQTSQGSGSPQSRGFSGEVLSTNSADVSGQLSTSNLLAAIMKSGVLSDNPTSVLENCSVQPPLPSGPPPIQALASSGPIVTSSALQRQRLQGNAPALTACLSGVVLPPLPPGPPPPSSLVSASSQKPNAASAIGNPLSSLLSSLVAKGMISSSATETPFLSSAQVPAEVSEPIIEIASGTSIEVPSAANNSLASPAVEGPGLSEPCASSVTSTVPNHTELEDLLGIDFKPEIIRELHPLVISSLFDDLKHQCDTCGLRFKLPEQLNRHSELHASENFEIRTADELYRKWYPNTTNWVAGNMEPPKALLPATSLEEAAPGSEECEPMVPADDSQSICALCGSPFNDFYSHDRDEWMYKGTVYLYLSAREGDNRNMDEINGQVPIVHAKCASRSGDNKDMAESDKMD